MSKFVKRIGTSSTKFAVEIHLYKVEIKLIQKCSVMVTFKRGEHVKETKSAPPLVNGAAEFDEKLSFPATLYYEKKKDGYLPKEATLELNIITPTTKRLAGITKFDLAQYANLGVQEQDVELKVGKCFDKDAKFFFKLHMIQLSDVSPLKKEKETPFSRKQLNHMNISDIPQRPSLKQANINPNPNMVNSMNILPEHSMFSSVHDASTLNQSKFNPAQQNRRTRSPGSKHELSALTTLAAHEQFAPNRRSKTVDMHKDSDDSLDLESHGVGSQIYTGSQNEIILEAPNLVSKVAQLEEQVKHYEIQNKQLEERASMGHQQYLNLVQEFQQMKEKYEETKQSWEKSPHFQTQTSEPNFESKPSTNEVELEARIHELSEKVKHLVAANQELEEKNHALSSQVEEKERRFESYKGPTAEDFDRIIRELQERLQATEAQVRNGENQLHEVQRSLQEAEARAERSERRLQEIQGQLHNAENKSTEGEISYQRDMKAKDRQIEDLEYSLKRAQGSNDEKTQKIGDLESLVRSYESEIEALKRVNKTNAGHEEEVKQLRGQIEMLENRSRSGEDSYKKRIEELSKQNNEMKREVEQLKSAVNAKETEKENVVTQVGLENEKLRRTIKELNAKILTIQYEGNELEHVRENMQELKSRNDSLEAELSKLKMGWAAVEVEKENLELCLRESEDNNKIRQDRLDKMEMDLFRLKTQIGEVVNAAMEVGDDELLDKLESIISGAELQNYRQNSKRSEA